MNNSKAHYKENDRLVSVHFDSILDFMDHKENGVNSHLWLRDYSAKHGTRKWYGQTNDSPTSVLNHALLGDNDLLESLEPKVAQLDKIEGAVNATAQVVKKVKRKKVRGAFGDEIDIHRVYAGDLENAWTKTERIVSDVKHSLVTMFIDIGGHHKINANDSLWRAAIAIKLYRQLINAGKSVRIVVGAMAIKPFKNKYKNITVCVTVKEYNQPLSESRLAAMAHIGFYRLVGFSMKCCQPYVLTVTGGLPTDTITDDMVPLKFQEEIEKGHTKFVYIQKANDFWSAKHSLEKAYTQMEKS